MHADRRLLLILGIFLALSVLFSWKSFITPGNFAYRDHWTIFDMKMFSEYFFQLFKNYGEPNLDILKRIPELWVHLLVDYGTYDKFCFALLTFAAFASSFFVSKKILDDEEIPDSQKYAIAFLAAFFYVVNPFNTEVFLRYYESINYAVFPAFFYALFTGFSKPDRRLVLVSGLLAAFMFMMVVHAALHIAICMFIVSLLCFRKPPGLAGLVKNGALFSLAFLSCSAFFLIPYVFLSSTTGVSEGAHALTTNMLDEFSSVMFLPKAMLLDYNVFWWPYVEYDYPGGNAFFILSFIFSGIVLAHSFFDRNRWSVASIIALAILFFFSKGNSPPFGVIYETFNFMLPGLGWLFRVPVKFLFPIPFFFSILLLRAFVGAARAWKRSLYPLGALLIVFLAVFSWPFFTGDMNGYITKNKYQYEPAVKDLNEFLDRNGTTTAVLFGEKEVSLRADGRTTDKSLHADMLKPGPFLIRELNAYYTLGNWSGLDSLSGLGVTYLVTNTELREPMGGHMEPAFNESHYSAYVLKNDSNAISTAGNSYLCYCHFDTARSIMRSPPGATRAGLIIFPYESFNFPESYLDSSDYVIMDSSPLVFPSVDSKSSYPFYYSTFASNPERGWARSDPFGSAVALKGDEKNAWNWEFEFGRGFAITDAAPKAPNTTGTLSVASLEHLNLTAADSYSMINGTNVKKLPYKLPISSLVSADLPLEAGGTYQLNLGFDAVSGNRTTIDILLFDQYGSLTSRRRLLDSNGSMSGNASAVFTVPYDTTRSMLAISSTLTRGNSSFDITDFSLASIGQNLTGKKITALFSVPESGDYDLYLHLLESRKGGELRLYLDGEPLGRQLTYAESNRLHWERVYSGPLSKGSHTMTAESIGGFNALNIIYFVKTGAPQIDLSNKTFIYRLTGKNDFSGESVEISENGSSSSFYTLSTSYPVSSTFYIYRAGEYSFSSSIDGAGAILIDGAAFAGDSAYLSKGPHKIEIIPRDGGRMLLDQVTFISKAAPPARDAAIVNQTRLDPSSYSVFVDSQGPFWLVFGRGNDANWLAWVNGTPYHPVSAYGAVNAYYINESGLNEVRIEYEGQKYVYIGAAMGLLGLIASCFLAWRYPE